MARINALTEITAKLKAKGFIVEEKVGGEYGLVSTRGIDKGDPIFYIDIFKQTLPYCCGVKELGDLDIGDPSDSLVGKKKKEGEELLELFIQGIFLTIKAEEKTSSRSKTPVACPIIFCSNGRAGCLYVEKALNALTNDFMIVSKTISPTSGNLITVYISKQ